MNNGFRLSCRCLLGHLLITFACSSKPTGRVFFGCAVKGKECADEDILGKQDGYSLLLSFVDGR